MKRKRYLVLILFVAVTGSAVGQSESVDREVIHKIKQEGLKNSQVMETAFYLTDVNGPRLSGSTGLKKAYAWTRKQLEGWGLSNAAIEPWGDFGRGWETQKCYVAMTAPYYQTLIATPKAWTPGTNGLIKGKPVFIKINSEGDFDQYKGKLKGKIVVTALNTPLKTTFEADAKRHQEEDLEKLAKYPDGSDNSGWTPERIAEYRTRAALRTKLSEFLLAEGVVAILGSRGGAHGTMFTSNGAAYDPQAKPALPELEMAAEHCARLVRLLEANIDAEVEMDVQNSFLVEDLRGYNVVAEITGTDKTLKSELVMLGGHLDSWHAATGATDNAAGCAVMMEAVRILKAIGAQPKRTIRIALWGSEEQGLFGSRNYVKNHFGDPETMALRPDHKKLAGYFNLDNGTGKIRGVYLQENDAVYPIFEQWLAPFHDLGAKTLTNRNTGGTDHLSFDAVGLPGFQFIQDGIDYNTRTHHTNMDTYDRLQKEDLMQASVIVASFVYHTAMRNEKLPRKPLPKAKGSTPSLGR
ncbi:MAG: M20/M25/M40 family metallo-hydrolase [Ferruginibacter sp.]|nr:M20/M25/M40 family metallo-hydrolase [Cytophagales bacterium]